MDNYTELRKAIEAGDMDDFLEEAHPAVIKQLLADYDRMERALELIDIENDNPAHFNTRINKLIVEAIGRRDESVSPPKRRRARAEIGEG